MKKEKCFKTLLNVAVVENKTIKFDEEKTLFKSLLVIQDERLNICFLKANVGREQEMRYDGA